MALTLGSVIVTDNGTVIATGTIGDLYSELIDVAAAELPGGIPSGAAGVPIKRAMAKLATPIGTWFYGQITTIITAKIPADASGAALQRTPDPNTANTDTQAPSVDKFLSLV